VRSNGAPSSSPNPSGSSRRIAPDRQRLESIGLLAGGIAHDFNNYLTVVLGTLEMLDAEIELTPTQRRFVESSQKMLERATSLTQQLLTFSARWGAAAAFGRVADPAER
jgi:signal transduction histidine kinase